VTTTITPSTDGFAAALRRATSAEHERAAMSPYMAALVAGELDDGAYAGLVVQHRHIYRELEAAAETWRDHPVAGSFVDERLHRSEALSRDLHHLLGEADPVPSPATRAYVARLREVCHHDAAAFVAHHYTRYLGDLAGGQMIRRALERCFGDGPGLDFYRFDLGAPADYLAAYRSRLDDAAWSAAEQRALIDEAIVAYHHNQAVLADLDTTLA